MSNRIRGKEASIRLAVDGQDQVGSFLKVVDWKVSPQIPIVEQEFCGEDRPDADVNAKGYKGTFTIHELKRDAEDLLDLMDANEKAHLAPPRYVITTYKKYRGTGAGDLTHVYHKVVMTCTQSTNASGSNYVDSQWEWFAPYRESI